MTLLIFATAVAGVSGWLIACLVGVAIPAVVAFITKEALPEAVKALILLFLSTATGILSALASTPPAGWAQWQHVLISIVVTFVAAAASQYAAWKPTGAHAVIAKASAGFGIGPKQGVPHG
jgi:hypothetical protein